MIANFSRNPCTPLMYYSPANVYNENVGFYQELSSFAQQIPKLDVLIIWMRKLDVMKKYVCNENHK